jgi:hypothetical protein
MYVRNRSNGYLGGVSVEANALTGGSAAPGERPAQKFPQALRTFALAGIRVASEDGQNNPHP